MTEASNSDARNRDDVPVVLILDVSFMSDEAPSFANRTAELMREVIDGLEGFLEGRVFEADDGKRVIITMSWKTRHLWAEAHWNEKVEKLLVDYYQSGAKVASTMCYERAVVSAGTV